MQDGSTALHLSAWKNKVEVVKVLVSAGANYRVRAHDGHSRSVVAINFVHHACLAWEMIGQNLEILGSSSSRIQFQDMCLQAVKNDGQTALHEAAEAGQKEAVEFLLSMGANAQAQDEVSHALSCICPLLSDSNLAGPFVGLRAKLPNLKCRALA